MTIRELDQISSAARRTVALCLATILAALVGCEPEIGTRELFGRTMGTTYSIRLAKLPTGTDVDAIHQHIEQRLAQINTEMSNWDDNSEISKFNRSDSTDWFPVSPDVAVVIEAALKTSSETGGAFDVTVGPLIELWGFGAAGRRSEPPSDDEIAGVRESVGWQNLEVRTDPPALKKQLPGLTVNLSAIAKGYGVDEVGELLESRGIDNYLVEIGGEVRVRGTKDNGGPWRVGIARPESDTFEYDNSVALDDMSLATSGDYRNFFEKNGRRFSHTIDPATARPVEHSLASVSVIAESTMQADALATAIMVMGPEKGYNYAVEAGLPALLISHTNDGFTERRTSAWIESFGDK